MLLKAANASSLLKRLLASAGETDGLLKGSSEEDSRPFCMVGERAAGASGLAGLLGLSSTEKSGSEKVYLIGSRYISGTFWAKFSSEEPRTWSNLLKASFR